MTAVEKSVAAVRTRQQRQWFWKCLSVGLLIGGITGCAAVLASFLSQGELSWPLVLSVLIVPPVLGLIFSLVRPRHSLGAAAAIDRQYGLKDRIVTALRFLAAADAHSEIHQLQLVDAGKHASTVDAKTVVPMKAPRSWTWGIVANTLAVTLGLLLFAPKQRVDAAPVGNEVVLAQADHVAESLEELEEFNQEDMDPEIQKLLEQLSEQVEQLKEPSLDPREALAKLSEMEAALQEQQQQLTDPGTEAALQAIGEAFKLAEPLSAAGQAMAEGKMDEAAKQLEKLEMPELDRQTEKALKEQIEKAAENSGQGSKRSLQEAVKQISQALGQGNRSQFKEGVAKLAGECKSQGKRKKLSDLLMKQCKCLSECKSECESECKNNGLSNKKGGKNWGLAASGNQPGEKTSMLKSPNEMKIKGQESASGDIETETLDSPSQEQQAVREYQKQAQKYEQLTESVLENEPIPLGHKQTIRKYFELIRPSQSEVDSVKESTTP